VSEQITVAIRNAYPTVKALGINYGETQAIKNAEILAVNSRSPLGSNDRAVSFIASAKSGAAPRMSFCLVYHAVGRPNISPIETVSFH